MGGDGGVIASDRRYMRGAGSASHTADSARASAADRAEAEKDAQVQAMQLCAITGSRLEYKSGAKGIGVSNGTIVACPFGRLYGREAAVQALLRRMEDSRGKNKNGGVGMDMDDDKDHNPTTDLGWQVRGLKDLHPVRFQLIQKQVNGEEVTVPICPITSVELNGLQPAYLIVKTKVKKNKNKSQKSEETDEGPNVLSDKAIREMGVEALQEEYGPFEREDMIRLAPPPKMMTDIKTKVREKRVLEKNKSSKKKRKKDMGNMNNNVEGKQMIQNGNSEQDGPKRYKATNATNGNSTLAVEAKTVSDVRNNVAAAVAQSAVLSGLFSNNQSSNLSEKEKKDKLFSSNC